MAKNYVQPGDTITVTAPYPVAPGAGLLVGAMFGVALSAAAQGATVEMRRVEVWDLAKAAGSAWTQGQKVYWDDAAKNVTPNVGAGNPLIGIAAQAQASTDVVGRVVLTGQVAA